MFVWDRLGRGTYHVFKADRVWVKTSSQFQQILICTLTDFGKALFLDHSLQCAEADQELYHQALVRPSLQILREPKNVLIIGGGDGSAAYTVLAQKDANVTMVELDKKVVELSKKYLTEFHHNVFDNKNLEMVFMEGKDFVERTNELYDLIIVDVTDPGVSEHSRTIYNKTFLISVKDRLSDNGLVVTQAGSAWYAEHHFSYIGKLMSEVFSSIVAYGEFIHSFGSLWGFYIGAKSKQLKLYHSVRSLGYTFL
ncbi:MAG: spermidine synthase [Thermoprotei archaeon]